MDKCFFCDSDCQFIDHGFNQQYICKVCGQYFFGITVQHIIRNRGNEISKQAKVNIAYRNLINKIETPERKVFWIGKGETNKYQEHNKGSLDKFLELEEIETEQVDHSEKPYLLLDVVGPKLKETFDRC